LQDASFPIKTFIIEMDSSLVFLKRP